MRSNEFTGATLREAVMKATAVYDRKASCETKSQRRCNDLIREISVLQRDLGRISDEVKKLEREAETLRESAVVQLSLSALAAVSNLTGFLRALRVVLRRLKQKIPEKLTERDIVDLLSALGFVGAAAGALYAASQLREAQRLARQAEEIERNGSRVGDALLRAISEYDRIGCGDAPSFTGS